MSSQALRRAWRLGPTGWGLLVEVVATGVLVELGLRLIPFQRLLRLFENTLPPVSSPPDAEAQLTAVLRISSAVFRRSPIPITCLRQSLILFWLLRRRRLSTQLRIGVARNGESVSAHSWIEYQGRALLEQSSPADRFPAILSVEAPSP